MQKDWITIGTAACSGIADWWLVRSGVGARSSSSSGFLLRERDLGACSRSPGSFRLCAHCQGPVTRPWTQAAVGHRTRWTNWSGLSTDCVIASQWTSHNTRQFLSLSSPSASPRSWPSLTVFWGCQGIFPALTTPKNCYTTMRDRGDAEAQNVPRTQTGPNKSNRTPQVDQQHNQTRSCPTGKHRQANRNSSSDWPPDRTTLQQESRPVSEPAWRVKSSWYLVATDDHMIPPPAQRAMAERAGATVAEVTGSHAIYESQPAAAS
jgi:hypothetical protein